VIAGHYNADVVGEERSHTHILVMTKLRGVENMWFKKKVKEEKPIKICDRSKLTINFKDNRRREIWIDGSSKVHKPWRKFYDWWFRRETDSYQFSGEKFSLIVRRNDIRDFEVKIEDMFENI
jgi:hypothetical protein